MTERLLEAKDVAELLAVPESWVRSETRAGDDLSDYFKGPVAGISEPQVIDHRDWALAESSYSSPASVNSRLTVLRMVLGWAKKKGYRADVPVIEYAKVRQRKGRPLGRRRFRSSCARSTTSKLVLPSSCSSRSGFARASYVRCAGATCSSPTRTAPACGSRLEDRDGRAFGRDPAAGGRRVVSASRSAFRGEDERVFCHPELGSTYRMDGKHGYGNALRRAFKTAGLDWPEGFRRCHDLRVTCGTNDAMAGINPAKLQVKLGHSDFRITQRYVNLAGVVFAEEASALERRLLGQPVESSTDLRSPERTEHHQGARNSAESASLD